MHLPTNCYMKISFQFTRPVIYRNVISQTAGWQAYTRVCIISANIITSHSRYVLIPISCNSVKHNISFKGIHECQIQTHLQIRCVDLSSLTPIMMYHCKYRAMVQCLISSHLTPCIFHRIHDLIYYVHFIESMISFHLIYHAFFMESIMSYSILYILHIPQNPSSHSISYTMHGYTHQLFLILMIWPSKNESTVRVHTIHTVYS